MNDTHVHLTHPDFATDLPQVLSRARQSGVRSLLAVSETLQDVDQVLALSRAYPFVHAAVGLHPEHVATLSPNELSHNLTQVASLFSSTPNITAIGEVGLDFTPRVLSLSTLQSTQAAKDAQRSAFAHFLALSHRHALPMTVHSRGAGRAALQLVTESASNGPVAVVMHAFDGRPIHAIRALELVQHGLYFSVPPSIVRSPHFEKLVLRLPLERLMLESDAPALAPVQGERNEPANLIKSVQAIARVKGLSESFVRETLGANTIKLFPTLECCSE